MQPGFSAVATGDSTAPSADAATQDSVTLNTTPADPLVNINAARSLVNANAASSVVSTDATAPVVNANAAGSVVNTNATGSVVNADATAPVANTNATAPVVNADAADAVVHTSDESLTEIIDNSVNTLTHSLPTIGGIDLNHIAQAATGASSGIDKTVDICTAVADELGLPAAAGAIGGGIGFGAVFLGSGAMAAVKIHNGIEGHDPEQIIDGSGDMAGATSNGAAAVAIATTGASGALGAVGQVARVLIAPLGVATGLTEAGLNTKQLVNGIKTKDKHEIASGILGATYGLAMAAATVGGGIPAIVISGVAFVAQFCVDLHAKRAAQRAAEAQEAQQATQATQTAPEIQTARETQTAPEVQAAPAPQATVANETVPTQSAPTE